MNGVHTARPLPGWQELPKLAVGNSRLMLSIATALHAPVAALLKRERANFLLVGPPAALPAVASALECHVDPAMARTLGLGQTSTADVTDLEAELMAVINETPLAVSNLSLIRICQLAGKQVDDAMHARLITVPAPANAHGMFEDLHGEKDSPAFVERLRTLARANSGKPSRYFLRALVKANAADPDELRSQLEKRRSWYLTTAEKIVARGRDLTPIHERMATVYAAALFALRHDILPWKRSALHDSLLTCIRDHVACVAEDAKYGRRVPPHVGPTGKGAFDGEDMIAHLQAFFRQNAQDIIDVKKGVERLPRSVSESAILKFEHRVNGVEYLFTNEKLLDILGSKLKVDALKAALKAKEWVTTEKSWDGIVRSSIKRTIMGRRRQFIPIRAAAFE